MYFAVNIDVETRRYRCYVFLIVSLMFLINISGFFPIQSQIKLFRYLKAV